MLLETGRLLIREFAGSDWDSVHVYASDPDVTKHMLWGPNSEVDTNMFFERVSQMQQESPRHGYELAVVLRDSGELIGGCSIYVEGNTNGEIGYCFNKRFWGNGYASEAANVMLRLGFGELGLHRIYATCRPLNYASAKVMEKNGMKREGYLREHIYSKGRYHDSLLYSILSEEFIESGD